MEALSKLSSCDSSLSNPRGADGGTRPHTCAITLALITAAGEGEADALPAVAEPPPPAAAAVAAALFLRRLVPLPDMFT